MTETRLGPEPPDDFSDIDRLVSSMSHRLMDGRDEQEPSEPLAPGDPGPQGPEEPKFGPSDPTTRAAILEALANGHPIMAMSLIVLDEDEHAQRFYCPLGHLMGAVHPLQEFVVARHRYEGPALCIVCGHIMPVPRYRIIGDEGEDIITAIKQGWEKRDAEGQEDNDD